MNALLLLVGELEGWELLLLLFVSYVSASVWLFALFDVWRSSFRPDNEKVIWVQVVKSLPLLGAIVYLAVGRNRKIK
jgi:hypothetical protein